MESSESEDFEPLIRKKKKSIVTLADHPTGTSKAASSSTPTIGRYGTSFCGPIHSSMSSFIQSALAESTTPSAGTAQIRKAVPVKASSSARSASAAAKRWRGREEKGTRSTKKVKLGVARLADGVQWPGSDLYSDPLEGTGGQDSDTIESYSDDSFSDISVHTSPEIGRTPQIDWLEINDSGGTCTSPGTLEGTRLPGATEKRADSAEMKQKRGWKKRRLKLQTSTPLYRQTLPEDVADTIDSDSYSSDEPEQEEGVRPRPFEPRPLATTPSETRSKIPISMATIYADPRDPPEYMSIETPPSSPELNQPYHCDQLDQSDINRTKTSEWLKQVSVDMNQSDRLSLSRSDSSKKPRRKKFVSGGLAEHLQRIIQRENSEISFWEHRSVKPQLDSQQDHSGCLSVQIHSLLRCPSLLLAEASLTHGALPDSADAEASLTHGALPDSADVNVKGDVKGGGEKVTVVFSQRCARFLQLEQCASIRIHPPWQSLHLPSISHNVLLCTHFCEVIDRGPRAGRVTSDPSPLPPRKCVAMDTSHLLNLSLLSASMLSRSPAQHFGMAPMLSRSPTKGLLPTRLFSSATPVTTNDSATGANTTDGEDERQLGGRHGNQCAGGLVEGMELARGRVIAELMAKIWRVYRRRMQQLDRWCFLVEDECGAFAEILAMSSASTEQWDELVKCGQGKTVKFNCLRISKTTSAKRNPELFSLISSICHQRKGQCSLPPSLRESPKFCYVLRATESTLCSIITDSTDEGDLPSAPVITRLGWDDVSSLAGDRVSVLGRIVHTHTEVDMDDDESSVSPPSSSQLKPAARGHQLFMVARHGSVHSSTSEKDDSTHQHSEMSFVQEVLVVYLKPSFPVEGLKGVLHRPGTAVLLKDALCQKMEGSTVFSMDACSLLIPISQDWTEHVGAYPELRLTDDQLSELHHLSEPHPPIICSANALTNTLLAVDGVIVGVDEEKAFSWPICSRCHGDQLAESADNPSSLYCEVCGEIVESPDVHIELSVYLKCKTLEHVRVSVKLLQSTIHELLPVSLSSLEKGFNISCVLKKHLHLKSCHLIERRQPIGGDDCPTLVLEEVDISFQT